VIGAAVISIDRRTLFAAAAAAGALPRLAFASKAGEVLDMTSTYPHYAAVVGFGRAGCEAVEIRAADRAFGS
jgi:hypothetical protein